MKALGVCLLASLSFLICAMSIDPAHPDQSLVQTASESERVLSSAELSEAAFDLTSQLTVLADTEEKLKNMEKVITKGSFVLNRGLCNFVGFCKENPARSCDEILTQPGAEAAELPDGEYWIALDQSAYPQGSPRVPAERLQCAFDTEGHGWLMMFDDTFSEKISQNVTSTILKNFRFKEVLVYTPKIQRERRQPVKQIVYYVDDTHMSTTAGKTFDEIFNNEWIGQDGWGSENDKGMNFPNGAVHYRYKFFGKIQNSSPYINTLYILDDGDIKDKSCQSFLDLNDCGKDFKCTRVNGTNVLTGRFAQTSIPSTPRGIISFGCTADAARFTQCGGCTYSGGGSDLTQSAVVQKMYVR